VIKPSTRAEKRQRPKNGPKRNGENLKPMSVTTSNEVAKIPRFYQFRSRIRPPKLVYDASLYWKPKPKKRRYKRKASKKMLEEDQNAPAKKKRKLQEHVAKKPAEEDKPERKEPAKQEKPKRKKTH